MESLADVRERYDDAVRKFAGKVKADVNVLAVIVEGSVAYDTVWHKSDIDITVVVRDQNLTTYEYSVEENGIILNAAIMTRTSFMRSINRANGASFMNSIYALSKIVYSTDETLQELIDEAKTIGSSDIGLYLLWQCSDLVFFLQKIEKWLTVKNDPMYAALYILKAAECVAAIEMAAAGEPPTREALMRAEQLNPEIIDAVYRCPMKNELSSENVRQTLSVMYAYLDKHLAAAAAPVLEYMQDGEPRTATMLVKQFKTGSPHILYKLMEYMVEKGFFFKTTQTIRITPKGRPVVDEIAYTNASLTK
ncbi:MAG: nucleotidyltransferase domain-containing protein [Defluviitaleaceae bacterium]|nr:nucleotidyltransferase domain-containing protein [Defluviitaleaceae bacterium]